MNDKRIKRIREWKNSGMMTVEAAFIVPILMFIIIGILLLMFFILDMSVVKSETMRIAMEAADSWKTDGEAITGDYQDEVLFSRPLLYAITGKHSNVLSTAQKRLTPRIQERLVWARYESSSVKASGTRVTVKANLVLPIKVGGIQKWTGMSQLKFQAESAAMLDNRTEYIRIAVH